MSTLMLHAEQNLLSLQKNKFLVQARAELKESLKLEIHKLLQTFFINNLVINNFPRSYQIHQKARNFYFKIQAWQTFQTSDPRRLHSIVKIFAKVTQELPLMQYCLLVYSELNDQSAIIDLSSNVVLCNN